jgi:hypothetical protein
MIPKVFKILRKGKSQVACIYIRYGDFCGKLRPIYIGQTDNIFSKRPERTNDPTAGDYEEIRRMESVSNKKRREEYEASLIIKLEPLKQRIYENLFMYKKYFSIAKNANLLNKEIKRDRLKKIIDFSVYEKTLKRLNELNKKVYKINNFYNEYFNLLCSNKIFKKLKKTGKLHSEGFIDNKKLLFDLIFASSFLEEMDKLEKYMFKKQRNLNKFIRYTSIVRQALRIKTKDYHPGEYGKYIKIDPFSFFNDIKTNFKECFFFKYINDFQNCLKKETGEYYYNLKNHILMDIKINVALEYCRNNKDKIIAEIIASKEIFLENDNLKTQNNNLLI